MNKKNDAAAFSLYSTVGHRGLALFRFYMSLHFVLFTVYQFQIIILCYV